MNVTVLKVTPTGKGYNIAHVRCGQLYGDCIASEAVTEPGEYFLSSRLQVKQGRLTPLIRVEASSTQSTDFAQSSKNRD